MYFNPQTINNPKITSKENFGASSFNFSYLFALCFKDFAAYLFEAYDSQAKVYRYFHPIMRGWEANRVGEPVHRQYYALFNEPTDKL